MTNFLRFFTLLIAISLIGCGATLPKVKPYKMDIQQGNVVTSEMLLQLRPGMTKSQVKFIMGTPLLVDSFRTNRWDYFYQLRKQGKIVTQRRVILDFEEDLLKRVRGDVVPKAKTVEDVTKELEKEAETKDATSAVDGVEPSTAEVTPIEVPEIDAAESVAETQVEAESDASPASVLVVPKTIEPVIDAAEAAPAEAAGAALAAGEVPTPEVVQEMATSEPEKPALPEAEIEKPKAEVLEKAVPPVVAAPAAEAAVEKVLTVMPSKENANKKVFRLDRSLDTTRIIPAEVANSTEALQESVVKEVKEDVELPEEDEPSFFERALEKIGF